MMRLKSWIQLCMWFGNALWRRVYGSSAAQQMLAGRLCFMEMKRRQGRKETRRQGGIEARRQEKMQGVERRGAESAEKSKRETVERKCNGANQAIGVPGGVHRQECRCY